jgi:thiol-disulfide isomerase/thioredoxin
MKSVIYHGEFNFTGTIFYPYAFRLQVLNDSGKLIYSSDMFFVDSGNQRVNCNINSVREQPDILNRTTAEENGNYKKAYAQINQEFSNFYRKKDSLSNNYSNNIPSEILLPYSKEYRNLQTERDSVLLQYTKKYPKSFVALWVLIYKLVGGYQPIYDSIYSEFSTDLKRTITGKRLYDQLKSSSSVNVGNKFPLLLLNNIKIQKESISINDNKEYTFIDFWFSHCFPCISQFDALKKIYQKYYKKKLDILSISVDDSAHIDDWKNVIAKFSLPWKQYLDLNGKEAHRLSIQEFPTNFLLDKNGKIIETNIGLDELQLLLEKLN